MTRSLPGMAQRAARASLYLLLFLNPFSKAGVEISFFILLTCWAIGWPLTRQGRASSVWWTSEGRSVGRSLLAYLAVCAIAVGFSSYWTLSLKGLVRKTLEYALFFVMASDIARHPGVCRRSGQALLWAGWLIVAYSLLQGWAIQQVALPGIAMDPIRHERSLVHGRIMGPYDNPNDLATFLIVAILFLAGPILWWLKSFPWGKGILGILLLGCLAWTQSRAGLLGLVVGGMFLLFQLPRRKWVRGIAFCTLALTAALLFIGKGHFPEVLSFSDPGSQERSVMWNAAWRMIQNQPVFGIGLNTFMANYMAYADSPNQGPAYAHNGFLQVAAETGLAGLACFLWFLGSLSSIIWKRLKEGTADLSEKPWLLGLSAGLIAFMVQSVFDTNLYTLRQAALFWTLAGVAFGASQRLRLEEASPRPSGQRLRLEEASPRPSGQRLRLEETERRQ